MEYGVKMATTTNNGWTTPDDTSFVKDGALSIRTLGSAVDTSTGKGLIAWQTYTPTFTNFTLGTGVINIAKFCQIGKTVHVRLMVTLGITSNVTGLIGVSLPVTAITETFPRIINTAFLLVGPVTGIEYIGSVSHVTTTRINFVANNSAGTYTTQVNTSATVPGTWSSGNVFAASFTYEAA